MSDLDERLAAVERALTDDETAPADLSDAAALERRLDALERRLSDLGARVADAEAGIQAVRGSVGEWTRAHDEVERIAQSALATAQETERRLDDETPPPQERPVVREPAVPPAANSTGGPLSRLSTRLRAYIDERP